jgi:hypothetical protein
VVTGVVHCNEANEQINIPQQQQQQQQQQHNKNVKHTIYRTIPDGNMNLNVTLKDLQRGQYEAQKKLLLLLHRFVQKRAIMKDPVSGSLPPKIVRSDLLNWMLEACGQTGVVVVHADRGLGKSTAAKFILKHSAGGIMFCNCRSTGSRFYWKGVAKAIGIPGEVYENDSDWEELLVKAVSAGTSPEALETASWPDRLMNCFLSICSGDEAIERDSSDTVPTIAGLDLSLVRKRPIIVFDDFNDVEEEDIRFMKHLYPIVKAKGVLLFVLVRDEATANQLIKAFAFRKVSTCFLKLPRILRSRLLPTYSSFTDSALTRRGDRRGVG